MSNVNSQAGFTQQGSARNQFPVLALAATTETIFPIATDAGVTNLFLTVPSASGAFGSQSPIDEAANTSSARRGGSAYGLPSGESNLGWTSAALASGRAFKVRFVGTGNAGANAAQTIQVNLYQGVSATLGSDKKIGTTGAALAAVAGGAFNFLVEATLVWDSTSQILSGFYTANIAFGTVSQFVTTTVVPNVVTGVTAAGLSFLASITMGNAAASTAQLSEAIIDRV